jgi:hypothetical protein
VLNPDRGGRTTI